MRPDAPQNHQPSHAPRVIRAFGHAATSVEHELAELFEGPKTPFEEEAEQQIYPHLRGFFTQAGMELREASEYTLATKGLRADFVLPQSIGADYYNDIETSYHDQARGVIKKALTDHAIAHSKAYIDSRDPAVRQSIESAIKKQTEAFLGTYWNAIREEYKNDLAAKGITSLQVTVEIELREKNGTLADAERKQIISYRVQNPQIINNAPDPDEYLAMEKSPQYVM